MQVFTTTWFHLYIYLSVVTQMLVVMSSWQDVGNLQWVDLIIFPGVYKSSLQRQLCKMRSQNFTGVYFRITVASRAWSSVCTNTNVLQIQKASQHISINVLRMSSYTLEVFAEVTGVGMEVWGYHEGGIPTQRCGFKSSPRHFVAVCLTLKRKKRWWSYWDIQHWT